MVSQLSPTKLAHWRPVYSDATQLDVDLSCVAIDTLTVWHRRNSTVNDDRQCNWPSWTAYSQSARSRSVVFLLPVLHCDVWYTDQRRSFPEKCFLAPLLFIRSLKALVDMSYKQACFFSIILTFLQIFHSKIPSPGKLVKTRHIWRHDLQTESTGSRRSELIGDSCSRCERDVNNSTSSWIVSL